MSPAALTPPAVARPATGVETPSVPDTVTCGAEPSLAPAAVPTTAPLASKPATVSSGRAADGPATAASPPPLLLKAREVASAPASSTVQAWPATCPAASIAVAALSVKPAGTPRSRMAPFS